jgi:hypothetical protein
MMNEESMMKFVVLFLVVLVPAEAFALEDTCDKAINRLTELATKYGAYPIGKMDDYDWDSDEFLNTYPKKLLELKSQVKRSCRSVQ